MKKQIEDEIERLKNERELIVNDIELSFVDIDEWAAKKHTINGKIEALEWCLDLLMNILNK